MVLNWIIAAVVALALLAFIGWILVRGRQVKRHHKIVSQGLEATYAEIGSSPDTTDSDLVALPCEVARNRATSALCVLEIVGDEVTMRTKAGVAVLPSVESSEWSARPPAIRAEDGLVVTLRGSGGLRRLVFAVRKPYAQEIPRAWRRA